MHVLKKALAFLREHNEAAFATVEDGKPKIRVFQIMRVVGPNLYFATAPHKEVYRQLQSNPNVEILAMAGNLSVRVTGRAVFDVPVEKLDYYDLTPTPPLFEHFECEEAH